ncbi:hypothetical protein [Ferviditalea candida]|uniref:Uncharacterized protein n=1 Tax=Ferviditalea candida TaxID=3108399 RepID=A0ABU5ZFF7_9BACL|nr:hypothetical protein [Paenibacillaceae bacterium T2]
MSILSRENEIKLDILGSLARSQQALSLILESMAGAAGAVSPDADAVFKYLRTIAKHQQILTEKITGMEIRKVETGVPARQWLNEKLGILPQDMPRKTKRR